MWFGVPTGPTIVASQLISPAGSRSTIIHPKEPAILDLDGQYLYRMQKLSKTDRQHQYANIKSST